MRFDSCGWSVTLLLAMAMACVSPSALGVATVSNAGLTVNFTDFIFRTAGGVAVDPSTIGVTTDDGFVRLDRVEIGTGAADATGAAQACNLAECGIISLFPLSIELDATSGVAGTGEVRGRSFGELTLENNTGMDLTFEFFLESDVSWDALSVDDAVSDAAFITWEVRFDYSNGGGQVALSVTQNGPEGGITVDEVCTVFPSDCSFRQGYDGFVFPNGTTQTFTGVADLFGSAVSVARVPEPPAVALILPALLALAWRVRRS